MKKQAGETEIEKVRKVKCYSRDFLCEKESCGYHLNCLELGNCVLRVGREYTLEEIGIVFGFSRQRADQIMKKCIDHFKRAYLKAYGD